MTAYEASDLAPAAAPVRTHRVAKTFQVVGELVLTFGLVLVLLAVYQLFWTGVETAKIQRGLTDDLYASWGVEPPADGIAVAPGKEPDELTAFQPGEGIGFIRIPRFGAGYGKVIVEGTSVADLAKGPGHYIGSALPGQIGNFAVAGHRSGHGEPFARFEELRVGDPIVIETQQNYFTYTIFDIQYPVPIDSIWAVQSNPFHPGEEPTEALMTLTTCHPRWGNSSRFLVFTRLTDTTPKTAGVLPDALKDL